MFGNKFSSSTSCSKWLHETEPGRLDHEFSGRFLKVATHPSRPLGRYTPGVTASTAAARGPQPVSRTRGSPPPVAPPWTARRVVPTGGAVSSPRRGSPRDPPPGSVRAARLWQRERKRSPRRGGAAALPRSPRGGDPHAVPRPVSLSAGSSRRAAWEGIGLRRLWYMTRLGVVYPTRVSIWRREERAKVLLEVNSSNSFEGAVGLSVSPAQAWRRGNPKAKHRKGRGAAKECWPVADGASRGQGGGRPLTEPPPWCQDPLAMCACSRENNPAPNLATLLQGTASTPAVVIDSSPSPGGRGPGRAPDATRRPPRAPRIDAGQRHHLARGRAPRAPVHLRPERAADAQGP